MCLICWFVGLSVTACHSSSRRPEGPSQCSLYLLTELNAFSVNQPSFAVLLLNDFSPRCFPPLLKVIITTVLSFSSNHWTRCWEFEDSGTLSALGTYHLLLSNIEWALRCQPPCLTLDMFGHWDGTRTHGRGCYYYSQFYRWGNWGLRRNFAKATGSGAGILTPAGCLQAPSRKTSNATRCYMLSVHKIFLKRHQISKTWNASVDTLFGYIWSHR